MNREGAWRVIKGPGVAQDHRHGFYWYDQTNIADDQDHRSACPVTQTRDEGLRGDVSRNHLLVDTGRTPCPARS
jgi:hypothetical protein